jgi:hypothetical protein
MVFSMGTCKFHHSVTFISTLLHWILVIGGPALKVVSLSNRVFRFSLFCKDVIGIHVYNLRSL